MLEARIGSVEHAERTEAKSAPPWDWSEERVRLQAQVDDQADQLDRLRNLLATVAESGLPLANIQESVAWRLVRALNKAHRWVAPQGSLRRRVMRIGCRAVLAVPKLGRRGWALQKTRALTGRGRRKMAAMAKPVRERMARVAKRLELPWEIRFRPISMPVFDSVKVSVVIPVYNHCADTLACLKSIVEHTVGVSYEVIVVDDGSRDQTGLMLRNIEGLVALRNSKNLGFIGSCNRGSEAATGEYLLFLNNDTTVTPGWLDSLLGTFREIPGAGLVGAKLLYPDGTLQEAGGVIWRDASGWNYGKTGDPNHPRYNFAREADYCSGACIIIPTLLFKELGGFDSQYAPAYYEDADLAFKVRHSGHKVIYQPMARVIHHEGLTSGRDVTTGVKSYQVANQPKFRDRWSERLSGHPETPKSLIRIVGDNCPKATRKGQVLVIDHRLPTPDRDAGSMRMVEIVKAIRCRGHHVTFIPADMLMMSPEGENLQRMGVEVVHQPYYSSVADYLEQHGDDFELVIVSRADVAAKHVEEVRKFAHRASVVFDTVDLYFVREGRAAEVLDNPHLRRAARQRKRQELELTTRVDATVVVSPVEKALLESECAGIQVFIVPTIVDLPNHELPGYGSRKHLVFIGGYEHLPNVDAVVYFVREILPLVVNRLPEIVFQIVGSNPPLAVQELAGKNVEVLGYVANVAPIFAEALVSVAPIRFGAGVKGKVNLTMAHGVPTVVSSVAAEGMHLVHGSNAMVADEPASFADAVVRLCESRELWEQLSLNARANVRDHFSVEAAGRRIDELLAFAGLNGEGSTPSEARDELAAKAIASLDIVTLASYREYQHYQKQYESVHSQRLEIERALDTGGKVVSTKGYCVVCFRERVFTTPRAVERDGSKGGFDWREGLICVSCGLNSRRRASYHLFTQVLATPSTSSIYLTEQATRFYHILKKAFPLTLGSEYLQDGTGCGSINENGFRHEDLTALSFRDESFDRIVSLEVCEHIPDYCKAFAECARVLKPGGKLLLTVPFDRAEHHLLRARVAEGGRIEHLEPPEYHGDPIDSNGCLCFHHFGWDLLDRLKEAGFRKAVGLAFWSRELCTIEQGGKMFQFVAEK